MLKVKRKGLLRFPCFARVWIKGDDFEIEREELLRKSEKLLIESEELQREGE